MIALRIGSSGSLLGEFVASFLHEVCPDAVLMPEADLTHSMGKGVRVTSTETGRWLFVSIESGPDEAVVRALAAGACAVLNLNSRPEDFRIAVDALRGHVESHVPMEIVRSIADLSLSATPLDASGQPIKLTEREREVLGLVATGCSNAEIANRLTISVNTVRSHLHGLAVKLDADNRVRVLANARALGLVDIPTGTGRGKHTA
jgi:DNA-binding NarL/FixJ family response regulator